MYKKVLLFVSIISLIGCAQKKLDCEQNQNKTDFEQLFTKDDICHEVQKVPNVL